jgi:2-methylcitrate dehydratase PrpD
LASLARDLAGWTTDLVPSATDLALADRSLKDTLAVTVAARGERLAHIVRDVPEAARWATVGHLLDFDDLHLESTSHVSVVCVAATLAAGGGARAYLAGAGVMVRLGAALGWPHYAAGWHATCTAGAPAAAAAAAVAMGLDRDTVAHAIALAVPSAGGVQRAFGTDAKSLQVGFAAEAGVRAARLARAGATADLGALEQWLTLVDGDRDRAATPGPPVPDGLAVKVFPCCYALQRPISTLLELLDPKVQAGDLTAIVVQTPQSAVQPLIHSRPRTGLEGKFSLEYGLAGTILDRYPGLATFSDEAVVRPAAANLIDLIRVDIEPGGGGLLSGETRVRLDLRDGSSRHNALRRPPGSPDRPPSEQELAAKVRDCAGDLAPDVLAMTWAQARTFLRGVLDE